jgi:hypothetical protein
MSVSSWGLMRYPASTLSGIGRFDGPDVPLSLAANNAAAPETVVAARIRYKLPRRS